MKARRPGQSALLLLDLTDIFKAQEIDYIVIGAAAASVHGSVRATTDADALVSTTAAGLAKLEKVLRQAGLGTELRQGDAEDPIVALLVVTDAHENRVDILAGLRGLDPGAFARAITVSLRKKSLRVVGREDFIAMKCFAGGLQDILDARTVLQAGSDRPIDIDLLRRLAARFGRPAQDQLAKLLGDT
jgi:hypothetical protein